MNSPVQKVWMKVNKNAPCQRCKKPDWCTYSQDSICCMRVQSDKPSKNGGWMHNRDDSHDEYLPSIKPEPQVTIDAHAMWKEWLPFTENSRLKGFANKLGVEPLALKYLGCVWAAPYNAWAFPMRDARGRIVGIRLRSEDGDKWAVKGSRAGCFFTTKLYMKETLFIVEGPTDCAAAMSMELTVIGRPSCLGCEIQIYEYIRLNKVREAVIVADNDAPGLRGAEKLQASMKVPSCIWIPPSKDIREFYSLGGDVQTIEAMIRNLVWHTLKIN